jgi:hypothetical protein
MINEWSNSKWIEQLDTVHEISYRTLLLVGHNEVRSALGVASTASLAGPSDWLAMDSSLPGPPAWMAEVRQLKLGSAGWDRTGDGDAAVGNVPPRVMRWVHWL